MGVWRTRTPIRDRECLTRHQVTASVSESWLNLQRVTAEFGQPVDRNGSGWHCRMVSEVENMNIQTVVSCQRSVRLVGAAVWLHCLAAHWRQVLIHASRWSLLVPDCGKSERHDVLRCRKDLFHSSLSKK